MLSQHQQDTGSREDLQIQPNLCFSDFRFPERAEFTEYVFHLGKTPMFILLYFQERNDKNQRKAQTQTLPVGLPQSPCHFTT